MGSQNIIDLEDIVKERSWAFYKRIRKFWQPRKLDDVNFIFDWSGVTFKPVKTTFQEKELGPDLQVDDKTVTIFKSVFENKSGREQTHSIKAERQTVAECKSSLSKGYSKGRNVGLTIQSPQSIVQASVGYSKGFSVTSSEETTEQRTLTWTIEGSLTVAQNSELTAEVQIIEEKSRYDFTTRVDIRGIVVVKITDKRDRPLITYTGDMCLICSKIPKDDKEKVKMAIEGETVSMDVVGECQFNYGSQQETKITEKGNNKSNGTVEVKQGKIEK